MFKDYSNELNQIDRNLAFCIEKIINIEQNLIGISDEINDIKEYLGMPRHIRGGNRKEEDFDRLIACFFRRDINLPAKKMFHKIMPLYVNNQVEKTIDENKYAQYIESIKSEWIEKIEFIRQNTKSEMGYIDAKNGREMRKMLAEDTDYKEGYQEGLDSESELKNNA